MISILFVAQSASRGGIVTVLGHLLENWPISDKRILLLAYNRGHGGNEFFNSLASKNPQIHITKIPIWDHTWALLQIKDRLITKFFVKAINRLIMPVLFVLAVFYFRRLCLSHKVDVVFSHNGGFPGGYLNRAAIVGAWFGRVRKIFLVIHNVPKKQAPFFKGINWIPDRLLCKLTSGVITVSKSCRDILIKNRYFPKGIEVIYNGSPIRSEAKDIKREQSANGCLIAYIGEISQRKGLEVLFQAISLIREPIFLSIYGKGEERYTQELQRLAIRLRITHKLEFKGFDPDVAGKLVNIDMLVLPSVAYESFGMVLLEAMRQMKPVIVSDVGGMKEVCINGKTGFVVPSNNPPALAEAITRLVQDPTLAQSFGEAGYKILCEKFSVERMVAQYVSLAE